MDRSNLAFTSGALAEGTDAATLQTGATIVYEIDGVLYSKAATNNISMAYDGPDVYSTPDDGTFSAPENSPAVRLYGVYLDAAGNFSVLPGPVALANDVASGATSIQWPAEQYGKAIVGAVRVQIAASSSFVPGTTDLSAVNVTDTYYNLSRMPSMPLTA